MRLVIGTDIYDPILIMIRVGNTTNITSWSYVKELLSLPGDSVTIERVKESPELRCFIVQLWFS